MTTTQTMSAAEPLTEDNERELLLLARRYEAVVRLLRQRDDLREQRRFDQQWISTLEREREEYRAKLGGRA